MRQQARGHQASRKGIIILNEPPFKYLQYEQQRGTKIKRQNIKSIKQTNPFKLQCQY